METIATGFKIALGLILGYWVAIFAVILGVLGVIFAIWCVLTVWDKWEAWKRRRAYARNIKTAKRVVGMKGHAL